MSLKTIRVLVAVLALGAAAMLAPPSPALIAPPVTLADLVGKSDLIVFGTVTAVEQGIDDSGLPYTQIVLEIDEAIRGESADMLIFRQFGLQAGGAKDAAVSFFSQASGLPRYAEGERVMLFLTPPSSVGFRTTVGFEQGRFTLGLGTLRNGTRNAGLFRDVDLSKAKLDATETLLVSTTAGDLDADAFVAFVRRAVRENWWGVTAR